ncbi:MAG TPA: helix-turn-helix transcriptional regulator [Candidatus Dormibacteraeota bacterium]|nr:helix-turn-helix transcriptional regulator [Candidatus Dormibacteraeota bacterium]
MASEPITSKELMRRVLIASDLPVKSLGNLVMLASSTGRAQRPSPERFEALVRYLRPANHVAARWRRLYYTDMREPIALPQLLTCAGCGDAFQPSRSQAYRAAAKAEGRYYCGACEDRRRRGGDLRRRSPTLNDSAIVGHLERLREKLGLTHAGLATRLGVSPVYWSQLRRTPGQVPEAQFYERMLEAAPDLPPLPAETPRHAAALKGLAVIHERFPAGTEAALDLSRKAVAESVKKTTGVPLKDTHKAKIGVGIARKLADDPERAGRLGRLAKDFDSRVRSSLLRWLGWQQVLAEERTRRSLRPLPKSKQRLSDVLKWAEKAAVNLDSDTVTVMEAGRRWLERWKLWGTPGRPAEWQRFVIVERLNASWLRDGRGRRIGEAEFYEAAQRDVINALGRPAAPESSESLKRWHLGFLRTQGLRSRRGELTTSALDEAVNFLTQALASGGKPAVAVDAEARAKGISPATLRRARQTLGVKARQQGEPGRRGRGSSWWELVPGASD